MSNRLESSLGIGGDIPATDPLFTGATTIGTSYTTLLNVTERGVLQSIILETSRLGDTTSVYNFNIRITRDGGTPRVLSILRFVGASATVPIPIIVKYNTSLLVEIQKSESDVTAFGYTIRNQM